LLIKKTSKYTKNLFNYHVSSVNSKIIKRKNKENLKPGKDSIIQTKKAFKLKENKRDIDFN